jgi:hypothetical protein
LKIRRGLQTMKRNDRPVLWDKHPTTKRSAAGRMKRKFPASVKGERELDTLDGDRMSRNFPKVDWLLEKVKHTEAKVNV